MDFRLTALALILVTSEVAMQGCLDGDIRRGCKRWCECFHGDQDVSTCRDRCSEHLADLKKKDRPRERQVADCLAAKGTRSCPEIALCGEGVLTPLRARAPARRPPSRDAGPLSPRRSGSGTSAPRGSPSPR